MQLRPLRLFLGFAAFAWGISVVGGFANSSQAADNSSVTNLIRHEAVSVQAPFVMPAIAVPVFPQHIFVITNFGAVEGWLLKRKAAGNLSSCDSIS